MTLKLKSTRNELWKDWKLAWYHHFTHIACAKKLRGLRQKLDALCVQNGQSLSKYQGFGRKLICYKGIPFFNLFQLQTFWAFNMHHSKPHHHFSTFFWLNLLFFKHFMIYFELKWTWIVKHCKWTLKWLKVGMVSSFHPHSMC